MNKRRGVWQLLLLIVCVLVLVGCGQGEGGIEGSGANDIHLKGTAAVGAALANKNVVIKDKNGKKHTTLTDSGGKYDVKLIDMEPPLILKVESQNNKSLFSFAMGSGVTNIHPLSDVVMRNWYGIEGRDIETEFASDDKIENPPSQEKIKDIQKSFESLLETAYARFGVNSEFDFFSSAFDADMTGFDSLLDYTVVTISSTNVTVKLIDPETNIETIIIDDLSLDIDITQPDVTPPSQPQGLQAFSSGVTSIVITWSSSSDNIGVAGYNIYRDGTKISSSPFPVFSDGGLSGETEYCYKVEAYDGENNISLFSIEVCATTLAVEDTISPSTVSNISKAKISAESIGLQWSSSESADVLGYHIFRSGEGEEQKKIATVVTTDYVDSNVLQSTKYCYTIISFDASGNLSEESEATCVSIGLTGEEDEPNQSGGSGSGTSMNTKPFAHAGFSQRVDVGEIASLNGSLSQDIDGDNLTYQWSIKSAPDGSVSELQSSTTDKPYFTVDIEGDYIISLIVNDGTVDSDSATVRISSKNFQPIAYAGVDLISVTGVLIQLDGSGSLDIEASELTYLWGLMSKPEGSTVELSDKTIVNPTIVPDLDGEYVISLVVNDGSVDSEAHLITVTSGNIKPVAIAIAKLPPNSDLGSIVTLDASNSFDANKDDLTYLWEWVSRPEGSNATFSDNTSVTPEISIDVYGNYEAKLVVSDDLLASAPYFVRFKITKPAVSVCQNIDGGFENGATDSFDGGWQVTNVAKYAGTYSLQPPVLSAAGTTSTEVNCSSSHTKISFKLYTLGQSVDFYIDDQLYQTYGSSHNWHQPVIVVDEGAHTYRWEVTTTSPGRPAVYLDNVIFE